MSLPFGCLSQWNSIPKLDITIYCNYPKRIDTIQYSRWKKALRDALSFTIYFCVACASHSLSVPFHSNFRFGFYSCIHFYIFLLLHLFLCFCYKRLFTYLLQEREGITITITRERERIFHVSLRIRIICLLCLDIFFFNFSLPSLLSWLCVIVKRLIWWQQWYRLACRSRYVNRIYNFRYCVHLFDSLFGK